MTERLINPRHVLSLLLGAALVLSGCDRGDSDTDPGAAGDSGATASETPSAAEQPDTGETATPARDVISERLAYAEVDEQVVYGHFAFPSDMVDPLPAIILFHEWWGLTDSVRSAADRLAAEGYIVLAVDLFGGRTASTPPDARALMRDITDKQSLVEDNIRQALDFVTETALAPKVASFGWGLGGGLSLKTAQLHADQIDAVIIYYGQVTADEDQLRPINAPILGLFAGEDRAVPTARVKEFEKSLERLRKVHLVETYPDVRTSFANPDVANFNQQAADDAWEKTLSFLKTNLAADED